MEKGKGFLKGLATALNASGSAFVTLYDAGATMVSKSAGFVKNTAPNLPDSAKTLFQTSAEAIIPGEKGKLKSRIRELQKQIQRLHYEIGAESSKKTSGDLAIDSPIVKGLVAKVAEYENAISGMQARLTEIDNERKAAAEKKKAPIIAAAANQRVIAAQGVKQGAGPVEKPQVVETVSRPEPLSSGIDEIERLKRWWKETDRTTLLAEQEESAETAPQTAPEKAKHSPVQVDEVPLTETEPVASQDAPAPLQVAVVPSTETEPETSQQARAPLQQDQATEPVPPEPEQTSGATEGKSAKVRQPRAKKITKETFFTEKPEQTELLPFKAEHDAEAIAPAAPEVVASSGGVETSGEAGSKGSQKRRNAEDLPSPSDASTSEEVISDEPRHIATRIEIALTEKAAPEKLSPTEIMAQESSILAHKHEVPQEILQEVKMLKRWWKDRSTESIGDGSVEAMLEEPVMTELAPIDAGAFADIKHDAQLVEEIDNLKQWRKSRAGDEPVGNKKRRQVKKTRETAQDRPAFAKAESAEEPAETAKQESVPETGHTGDSVKKVKRHRKTRMTATVKESTDE